MTGGQPERRLMIVLCGIAALALTAVTLEPAIGGEGGRGGEGSEESLLRQTREEAGKKSVGCLSCHEGIIEDPHPTGTVHLGCVDCHLGDATVMRPEGTRQEDKDYVRAKKNAHVRPRFRKAWKSSANPEGAYTLLNEENVEFVQFVNPGDLRTAGRACGSAGCHVDEVRNVRRSMMSHGAMLWSAALYNNGGFPIKDARFGDVYSVQGHPVRLVANPFPSAEQARWKGLLPWLDPLPRFELGQPGNVLRIFERGQGKPLEVGIPELDEEPGKPLRRLSERGLGTLNRTDPVFLGLQKTRLLDPTLNFLGTNDHPGDYRSSGCTACHVLYANDRSPVHSEHAWRSEEGWVRADPVKLGNRGWSRSGDKTIPRGESGHPIRHQFTRSIPTSQCIVCHVHPGTTVTNTYTGFLWWDNESDGDLMYPDKQEKLGDVEIDEITDRNPEGAALRGKWSDYEFLATLTDEINPRLKHSQFADFHGHGWVFRAVFKQDRQGRLLDDAGRPVEKVSPQALAKAVARVDYPESPPAEGSGGGSTGDPGGPVHLKDIHLEKGMHCIDCHFVQDSHGDGNLYGAVRDAVEIDCVDCHGTIQSLATLVTSGPASRGRSLRGMHTPFGEHRFFIQGRKVFQRSAVVPGRTWQIVQTRDTIDPDSEWSRENPDAARRSRYAKTLQKDGSSWGGDPPDETKLAHANSDMTCHACHTSWMASCFGCHLSMTANRKKPLLHYEGTMLRNWTAYNYQTLRDDAFMIGRDGTVTGNRYAPARSACAVLVSSQNQNREWVYSQQQTVSAEGFSGQAFSTHFAHTVRATETKQCTECHVSRENDNNAFVAQLLMQGSNFYNWMGRFVYVGMGDGGYEAVVVTERDEPQAVIGSTLHRTAFPEEYARHEKRSRKLKEAYHHHGHVYDLQLRGEYLYAAEGHDGLVIYDVANIDHKGFSERMITAPASPLGQRFYVRTKDARAVASPSTLAIDPTRARLCETDEGMRFVSPFEIQADPSSCRRLVNEEQPIHPIFAFLYVADEKEGLVVVGNPLDDKHGPGVATLLDGDPSNNFLKRAVTFNPDGRLDGARAIAIVGVHALISCEKGLAVVSLENPLQPRIAAVVGAPALSHPGAVTAQFRYAFVCDAQGLKVIDITDIENPRPVPGALVPFDDARGVYVSRTYAYVAAGAQGLAIVDVTNPERPHLDQVYDADGKLDDTYSVRLGMTNASLFAYLADGRNGLRVVQLTSPEWSREAYGFSPRPTPKLIASHPTRSPAVAISEGIDRDRAVDEAGNQLAVFGRRGARPMNREELRRMYLRGGRLYTVTDDPQQDPMPFREEAP